MNIINSVESILGHSRKNIENDAKATLSHVEGIIENDTSRVIHSLTVTALTTGKDITVRLDHASGEVKRIVINGVLTVEGLAHHLLGLTAVPIPASPVPAPAPVS